MRKNEIFKIQLSEGTLYSHAEDSSKTLLKGLTILAGVSSLIALIGFIILITETSFAIDPPSGFQRGGGTFNNPYAAPGAQPMNGFDDEEDDSDSDFAGGFGAQGGPAGGNFGGTANNGNYNNNTARTKVKGGVTVGGSEKGLVNEGARSAAQPYANVDDEGFQGSNEIVTDFNFPDADIMDIAKALGKLTGKNFILDKEVKGKISIISNSPITVREAWRAFLTALDMTSFALIPSGKFIRIARQRDARDKQLRTYTGKDSPDSDALITKLIKLKFLNADEVARNFRSFMPANSRIIPYEQTNTIIVTDTGSNITKLSKLLSILDVEGYDAGIEVIPVKFASAADLAKLIDQLIPGSSAGPASRFPGAGRGFTARKTKEGGVINTIIADDRTNNLIIHANTKGAEQVRALIAKLDRKLNTSGGGANGGKVHVVYLQFANAEEIANTLNNITTGAASKPAAGSGSGTGTGVNPVQATLFEGNIKVSADKSTNSLVVTASPADFETVRRVVNRLDIPRDQVYVESTIMELSVDKSFNFSTNIVSPQGGLLTGSVTNPKTLGLLTNPLAATGAILPFMTGKTQTIQVDGKDFKVKNIVGLINTLQKNAGGNILATPQILTMDNIEAEFVSEEKVPVASAVAGVGGSVQSSFTDKSAKISLNIKPSINKMSNFVKLDIKAQLEEFSDRASSAAAGAPPGTSARSAKTTITVADGDTVVLGGLTKEKVSESQSKVPLLGDIPVLGWLFKSEERSKTKTNLLIFLTPKIIRQYEAIRTVLDQKLKERDDFLEENADGKDLAKTTKEKIIRSLPDVTKFKSTSGATDYAIDKEETQATVGNISAGKTTTTPTTTTPPANGVGTPAPNLPPPGVPSNDPFGNGFEGGAFPMDNSVPLPPPSTGEF